MANLGKKAGKLRILLSIVMSLAVAFASWLLIGYCPRNMAGITALKNAWFWAGQACDNQNGFGAIGFIPVSIWLVAVQTALNFGILSPKTRTATKYISVITLSITFFILYLLMFAF